VGKLIGNQFYLLLGKLTLTWTLAG